MTDTISIPLNKLLAWEGNVRKTDPGKGIDELAASIFAHGLLQSLVVRKDKRGKYAVVAGRRRLLALESLVESGSMKPQTPIPCQVLDDGADATEISLAENVVREAMHPADEFEAFKALIEKGMPVADVAARFGVTETVVQKRLKLAQCEPCPARRLSQRRHDAPARHGLRGHGRPRRAGTRMERASTTGARTIRTSSATCSPSTKSPATIRA